MFYCLSLFGCFTALFCLPALSELYFFRCFLAFKDFASWFVHFPLEQSLFLAGADVLSVYLSVCPFWFAVFLSLSHHKISRIRPSSDSAAGRTLDLPTWLLSLALHLVWLLPQHSWSLQNALSHAVVWLDVPHSMARSTLSSFSQPFIVHVNVQQLGLTSDTIVQVRNQTDTIIRPSPPRTSSNDHSIR